MNMLSPSVAFLNLVVKFGRHWSAPQVHKRARF